MSLSKQLAKILGTPFSDRQTADIVLSNTLKEDLYNHAYKNKVGLYYLTELKNRGIDLGDSLNDCYLRDFTRYEETYKTAVKLSNKISDVTKNFAMFKFLKPYPHTPSDVDVLLFQSETEFQSTVAYLLQNGYHEIATVPSQVCVYDLRGGYENLDTSTVNGKSGGKYYIDLYNKVSASHVVYLNNSVLCKHIEVVRNEDYGHLQNLRPVADLPVVLSHSIIPEQLFTFGDFYTALYYIKNMDSQEIKNSASIFKDNSMSKAGTASLQLICSLHDQFFGFIPEKLEDFAENLGVNVQKCTGIMKPIDMPYRYSTLTLASVLKERMKDKNGFESIISQVRHTISDPNLARWVLYNMVLRRTRETY
jgi:hypothetical protein